jgi:hypothetical protein
LDALVVMVPPRVYCGDAGEACSPGDAAPDRSALYRHAADRMRSDGRDSCGSRLRRRGDPGKR